MIKRTLYFGNLCTLKKKDMQMYVDFPVKENKTPAVIPIEDIGIVVLDSNQIVISHALISALMDNNCALISCNDKHLPYGLMLPMFSHHAFTQKMHNQINSSLPLRKNLWKQTVIAKISNQAALLRKNGKNDNKMQYYIRQVKSGDPENIEGRAAAYYWDNLFNHYFSFYRSIEGGYPNSFLNYGYAVLLAVIARSIVASGMIPSFGIHHRNKYNPWCLASDIMEPYRPFVDKVILNIMEEFPDKEELTPEIKRHILKIPAMDIVIDRNNSPLMIGTQRTTASLADCFEGTARRILYPELT